MEAETAFSSEKESGSGSSKAVNVTAGVYLAGKPSGTNRLFTAWTAAISHSLKAVTSSYFFTEHAVIRFSVTASWIP